MMEIKKAYTLCMKRLLHEGYSGYDPYDGASSNLGFIKNKYYPRLFSTYFNKFSPINFRPLLRVPKSIHNQTLGFVGRAMFAEYINYQHKIDLIADKLVKASLIKKYNYHCWDALGFQFQVLGYFHQSGMTDVIGNEAIGRFFLELYKKTHDDSYRVICISIRDYFLNELLVDNQEASFFKYTPTTPKNHYWYNASIIAAAYIVSVSKYFKLNYNLKKVESSVLDVMSRQKINGEWWYSINLTTGHEKKQIDFHQGFILDALLEYMKCNSFEEPFVSAYEKGIDFYHTKQFLPNGQGIYRYPKKWPVNIHNQAQGIITFTRAAESGFGDNYLDFARTIAEWTMKHMQDPDGHFYYMKFPLFTNKIPYIRWSDAAMVYALSVYQNAVLRLR